MSRPAPTLVLAIGALVLLMTACSSNEAKGYVPEASELCCHGNWRVADRGGEEGKEEGDCRESDMEEFFPRGAEACYYRIYYNSKIRFGEPEDLTVHVALMETTGDAEEWLAGYSPSASDRELFNITETDAPYVGDEAKAWEYEGENWVSTEVVFRRENLGIVAWADDGFREDRDILVESVDEAILDRFREWE